MIRNSSVKIGNDSYLYREHLMEDQSVGKTEYDLLPTNEVRSGEQSQGRIAPALIAALVGVAFAFVRIS